MKKFFKKIGIVKFSDLASIPKLINAIRLMIYSNFFKYAFTGVIITIISTALLWFFVDIMHLYASIMSLVLALFIFFLKFFFHTNLIKIFNNSKNVFIKYTFVTVALMLLTSFFLWLFVDTLRFSVIIINPIATIFMFFIRFYMFKLFKMLLE